MSNPEERREYEQCLFDMGRVMGHLMKHVKSEELRSSFFQTVLRYTPPAEIELFRKEHPTLFNQPEKGST